MKKYIMTLSILICVLNIYYFSNITTSINIDNKNYFEGSFYDSSESYYNDLKTQIENDSNKDSFNSFDIPIEEINDSLKAGFNFGNGLDMPHSSRDYKIKIEFGYDDKTYYSYSTNFRQNGTLLYDDTKSSTNPLRAKLKITKTEETFAEDADINFFRVTISNSHREARNKDLGLDIQYIGLTNGDKWEAFSSLKKEYSFQLDSSGSSVVINFDMSGKEDFNKANKFNDSTYLYLDARLEKFISDYKGKTADFEVSHSNGVTATDEELDALWDKGIRAIRLPVTWYSHMDYTGTVDQEYFDYVNDIVDRMIAKGFYVIVNIHHDTGKYGWISADRTRFDLYKTTYQYLCLQIANNFKMYGDHLILEGPNEVLNAKYAWSDSNVSEDDFAVYNELIQIFTDEVRRTGYNNKNRFLLLNTYCAGYKMLKYFEMPNDTANDKIFVGIHDYSVNDLGSLSVFDYLEDHPSDTSLGNGSEFYNKYHLLLGEYGMKVNETLDKRLNFYSLSTAKGASMSIPMFAWDDGGNYNILGRPNANWSPSTNGEQVIDAILSNYNSNYIPLSVSLDPESESKDNASSSSESKKIENPKTGIRSYVILLFLCVLSIPVIKYFDNKYNLFKRL